MNRDNIANIMAVLAIGILLLAILIVACGSAAQTAQESATPAGNPAPTDTPTPTDVPTPTNTFLPLPTLAPTPTAIPNRSGMDSFLTAASIEYEKQQAEGGASGQAEPELIRVQIFLDGAQERDEIVAFLEQQGVEYSISQYRDSVMYATVPASLLTTLAAHPSFGEMERNTPRYPNLSWGLNSILAWYEAGMMPDEDSNPTYAELTIAIEGDENYDNIRSFLKNNGAVMGYEDYDNDMRWKPRGVLIAYVSIAQVLPLAEQPGFLEASVYDYPVPEWLRFTREPVLPDPETETPAPSATPHAQGSVGPGEGISGAAAPTPSPTSTESISSTLPKLNVR